MLEPTETTLEHHSTLVSIAALIVNAMESYGLDVQDILRDAGFEAERVYSPAERVSTLKIKRLWDLAIEYSGDPCFGLTYVAYIQPAALHGLGFAWLASHTLKDGLTRLVRYQRMLDTGLKLELRETRAGYCVYDAIGQNKDPFQFPNASYHSTLGSVYKVCQIMMGPDIKPVRVTFEHSCPPAECRNRLEQFFEIPVRFNASETAITFDKQYCELPAPAGNPELARINDHIVISYLNQFDQDDIVTQTRKYIIDHLPSGVPRQTSIASDLNLSLRNFQRKLSQAGSNYAELLNQVRHDMACQYLQSPEHQIITISYLLGYSDPSNFARAFKRWNGKTPYQYRQETMSA